MAGYEVVTYQLFATLDSRVGSQHLVYLVNHLLCAVLTGSRSHRDRTEEYTCVLVGYQSCLGRGHRYHQRHNTHHYGHTGHDAVMDDVGYTILIFRQDLLILVVEAGMEAIDERILLLMTLLVRFQEHGTQRG